MLSRVGDPSARVKGFSDDLENDFCVERGLLPVFPDGRSDSRLGRSKEFDRSMPSLDFRSVVFFLGEELVGFRIKKA